MISKTKSKDFRHNIHKKSTEEKILIDAARKSSALAVRESRALGLTIKIISKGNIVEKLPNGKIKITKKINDASASISGLKKGTVLWRR